MIILIAGASHTGKTVLAQRILEEYKYPYLSIDHLKMGLIRSGNTELTPEDDDQLVSYLWPIVREIIKTAIENGQNLIIEGGYIPFDWKKDFTREYTQQIRFCCLIMSRNYVQKHFDSIKKHACDIENRGDDSQFSMEKAIEDNAVNLEMCRKYGCNYLLIDDKYNIGINNIIKENT
ncbi:MAG: adenylate kinase [Eubacteriales bacterium]